METIKIWAKFHKNIVAEPGAGPNHIDLSIIPLKIKLWGSD